MSLSSSSAISVQYARSIRSYVCREKKLTQNEQHLWDKLWPIYGLQTHPINTHNTPIPLVLEIGFGEGQSLHLTLTNHPNTNFLGIEVYQTGIFKLMLEATKSNSTNLKIFHGDALDFMTQKIPPESIQTIHLFFPDPWPKRRHHKRRLLNPPFLAEAARILKPNGCIYFVTDWDDYANHAQNLISQTKSFTIASMITKGSIDQHPPQHPSTLNILPRPVTKYEKRAIRLGHTITEIVFLKN